MGLKSYNLIIIVVVSQNERLMLFPKRPVDNHWAQQSLIGSAIHLECRELYSTIQYCTCSAVELVPEVI